MDPLAIFAIFGGLALFALVVIASASLFQCESIVDAGRHRFRLMVRPLRRDHEE